MEPTGQRFQRAAHALATETTQRDNDAMAAVWHLLRIARHAETQLEFEVHRPHGWSWLGFRIMANLYVLGDMEPAQLADDLEISRPTVSTAARRLERDGLLTRSEHPDNRTRVRLTLTDAGRAAVQGVANEQVAGEVALVAGLSAEELGQLTRLLTKMYDSLPLGN